MEKTARIQLTEHYKMAAGTLGNGFRGSPLEAVLTAITEANRSRCSPCPMCRRTSGRPK